MSTSPLSRIGHQAQDKAAQGLENQRNDLSSYEVRPVIQQRLAAFSKGDNAVLLVDEENKVTDVAFIRGE